MARRKMYQRADGLYEKKITISGKRHVFRAASEREVMQKIAAFQEREERGPSFEEEAVAWWVECEQKIRYGTVHGYQAAMRRAVEYFGQDAVRSVEAADIHAFLLYLAKRGYAHKTVKNQLTVLRQIFLHALMARHIRSLPTDGVSVPAGLSHHSRQLAPDAAIEAIKATGPEDFLLPALILYTGARCGEALALQGGDIDFHASRISINKAVVYHSNQPVISPTKTQKGERTVPLLRPLVKLLAQRGPHRPEEYIIGGAAPITKSALYRRWESFCRAHGLAHVDEERTRRAGRTVWACEIDRHTLRHEYATILYDAGIDKMSAMEFMGHADLATTEKIYTHIRQSRLAGAAAQLDAFLTEKAQ
ncbi:MAG: hypothetical protein DBY17_07995 [Oscillospiraceae bacterium]|nr:MAG: hypothetical protein DBY17_07995 [Oscillospiraceae bacterium]